MTSVRPHGSTYRSEHGYSTIHLLTQDIFEDAARMYLKFGFNLLVGSAGET
ncbi:MAG: hypothetical protein JW939_04730 [Candidatus Thermoplasmatota archaeon]|nr:hypothetical protein [Candidatus Thermoplasmatota archaeon]